MITSARSYKEPASPTEARAEIARCAGTQFDPRLVRAFVNISLGKMRLVMGPLSWLSHAPLLARLPLTPFIGASLGGVAVIATTAAAGIAGPQDTAQAASLRAAAPHRPIVAPPRTASARSRHPARRRRRADPHEASRAADADAAAPEATRPDGAPDTTQTPAASARRSTRSRATTAASRSARHLRTRPRRPRHRPRRPARLPHHYRRRRRLRPPFPPAPAPPTPNAAPSFSAGANKTVLEDAGAQSVAGWATAISPGPASEASQNVTFTVTADTPALFAVQPAIAPNGKLTYTSAANANGLATVTVTAVDDGGTANGGQTPAPPARSRSPSSPVNDAPSFTAGANQTVLEDTGAQSVAGWATAMSPGPANESSQTVSFTASADTPALFAVQPAIAPDGTLTYTPAPNANGVATVTVTALDNGGTANGGTNTSRPQTFTITITAVNDAPSFTAGANQTVLRRRRRPDRSPAGRPRSRLGPRTSPRRPSASPPAPTTRHSSAVQPAIAADGTLTYTPAPNANGVATITVTALDNGGTANGGTNTSAPVTFTITVDPVNDAPSFSAGSNQSVVSLLGAQTVPGWATGITAGPADESSQNVTFIVSSTNGGLFAVQPAIAPDGTLTYTPALLALGSRDRHRARRDDGGSPRGSDTSAPQTFTITIL